jgi:hypothetical protein
VFYRKLKHSCFPYFTKNKCEENTVKKTEYDLRIFREYLAAINEQREIETPMFSELQNILILVRNIAMFAMK